MRYPIVFFLAVACTPNLHATCAVSASPVSFGVYFPGSVSEVTGNVQVTCSLTGGTPVSYNISLSTGDSGSYAQRQMRTLEHKINYNLYFNAAHTTVWGDGTAGTVTASDSYPLGLLEIVSRNYAIYGRIPAAQNPVAGTYSDTIVVTVNY